jgi:adenylosuccinate synthase
MPASIVIGGQFGSEGKGKTALEIARQATAPVTAIRVGGSNSGHTAYHTSGRRHILRQVPAAAIDGARVVLPAGSYIDVDVLLREIEELSLTPDRLIVDGRAKIIASVHRQWEAGSGLRGAIGSTGSGTGAAVIANVARASQTLDLASPRASDIPALSHFIGEAETVVAERLARRERIVVEGTQGYGLSLNFGDWPFVTSRDTTAAAFAAEAGIPVTSVDDVTLVLRCHPIRVGGQSGKLPLETDWARIATDAAADRDLTEYTTVTGRVRRVADFHPDIARQAVQANGPTRIVLNHLDYVDWSVRSGVVTEKALAFVQDIERRIGRRIDWLGLNEHGFVDRPAVGNVHLLATG